MSSANEVIIRAETPLAPNVGLSAIHSMEKIMLNLPQELKIDPPVRHYCGTGTYCRVMTVPPGVIVSGRMHRGSTVTIILKGEVAVYSNHGFLQTASAGDVLVTPERTKRLWYTTNGCEIMTVHESTVNSISVATLEELEKNILIPIQEEQDYEHNDF